MSKNGSRLKWIKMALIFLDAQFRKCRGKGLETATKGGKAIITIHLEPVAEGFRELQNTSSNNRNIAKKKLKDIDANELVAYLPVRAMVHNSGTGLLSFKTNSKYCNQN